MRGFFTEFKNFAIKGNMVDMAIGIIIGASFNAVVNTLVKKIIMPPLSILTGGVDMSDLKFLIQDASEYTEEIAIGYGDLFNVLLDFLIVALTIFIVIKGMNRFRDQAEDVNNEKVETPKNIELLSKIEKLLEEQNSLLRNKQE
jgi:large conductance mechanosensitive channel